MPGRRAGRARRSGAAEVVEERGRPLASRMWRSAIRSRSAVDTPGASELLDQREDLGDDPAGGPHLRDLGLGLARDHAGRSVGCGAAIPAAASSAAIVVGDLVDLLEAVDREEDARLPVVVDDLARAAPSCWAIRARTVSGLSSARWYSSEPSMSQTPGDVRRAETS